MTRLDHEEPSLGTGNWESGILALSDCSLESMRYELRGCGWHHFLPGALEIKKDDLQEKSVRQTLRGRGGQRWGEVLTARQPLVLSCPSLLFILNSGRHASILL